MNKSTVSPALRQAILQVWNDIAPCVEALASDNTEAIEMCIDADRLVLLAESPEAQDEMRALVAYLGYPQALSFIASQITIV